MSERIVTCMDCERKFWVPASPDIYDGPEFLCDECSEKRKQAGTFPADWVYVPERAEEGN